MKCNEMLVYLYKKMVVYILPLLKLYLKKKGQILDMLKHEDTIN